MSGLREIFGRFAAGIKRLIRPEPEVVCLSSLRYSFSPGPVEQYIDEHTGIDVQLDFRRAEPAGWEIIYAILRKI